MNIKLYILLFCLDYVNSVDSYRFLKLYDKEICPNADSVLLKPLDKLFDRKVKLQEGKDSAVVVEQTFDYKHFRRTNNVLNCNFKIDSRKYNKGIFAVIRRLSFRRGEDVLCRDYIKFEYSNETYSEKMCGNVTSSNIVAVRDGGGKLKVEINIDTSTPLGRDEENVEFSIVFTGFNDCDKGRIPCFPDDETSCISKDFEHDHIQNCPDPCLDEDGCVETKRQILDPSNLVLSAITSLIFTMIIFGACLWLCWKYRECSDDREREQFPRNRQANIELRSSSPESATSSGRPTAPPLSHAPSLEKHDLPPAYDELFPVR